MTNYSACIPFDERLMWDVWTLCEIRTGSIDHISGLYYHPGIFSIRSTPDVWKTKKQKQNKQTNKQKSAVFHSRFQLK